ncbi:MAG: DsbA family oxidoreductase [Nitriliruptoraceae bacterium]
MSRTFTLAFDYLCPFARNASEHVTAGLRAGADWDVRFVPYSLAQGHVGEDEPDVWDRDRPLEVAGVLALAAGVTVRDTQPERFLDVHDALFAARHDHGRDLKEREVVADALTAAGVDPQPILADIDQGRALATVRSEHEQVVTAHQAWGVPTFVTDTRAVFVRLLERPHPDPAVTRGRIEQVLDLVDGHTVLHEFKQADLPL